MGMSTEINGQHVPVEIAYGVGHQVVREYDGGEQDGFKWLAGTTTLGLPWFREFRDAVMFLQTHPFAGYIQTQVLDETGTKLSWVTAGVHYRKQGGSRGGPISSISVQLLDDQHELFTALAGLAQRTGTFKTKGGQRICEAVIGVDALGAYAEHPLLELALLDAHRWCCQTLIVNINAREA